jgi:hypothetical protein
MDTDSHSNARSATTTELYDEGFDFAHTVRELADLVNLGLSDTLTKVADQAVAAIPRAEGSSLSVFVAFPRKGHALGQGSALT